MLSDLTRATLLLTLRTTTDETERNKPLDVTEWNSLTYWLAARDHNPVDLLTSDADDILENWEHSRIGVHRLRNLLERSPSLEDLYDRWSKLGIWVIARSEPGYPHRLQQRLGDSAPPALFGIGNPRLFENPALAMVGSRDAHADELALAADLGRRAAAEGFSVISGGARGVDTQSEQAAFQATGTVVSILADSLVRTAQKWAYRDHLTTEDLALITPYSPDAGFSSGNAMGRNRLIYCMADAAVAVSSTLGRGGTFSGASEAIRRGLIPVWVPRSNQPGSGNHALIELGGHELPTDRHVTIQSLTEVEPESRAQSVQQVLLFG